MSLNNFDLRAANWDKELMHFKRSEAIVSHLRKMVDFTQSKSALEYGAGTGILSFMLQNDFPKLTLMDNSVEMINECKRKIIQQECHHFHALVHDLCESNYDEKFDIVFTQMALHHIKDTDKIIRAFYEVLNLKGYIAIADLYKEDGFFHDKPTEEIHFGFDLSDLSAKLNKAGFINVNHQECFQIEKENGKKYPVFLLVAQKV